MTRRACTLYTPTTQTTSEGAIMSETQRLDSDVRIIRRNLNKGFISQAKVDEMLADLPDVEGSGEWFDPMALDENEEEETTAEAADVE